MSEPIDDLPVDRFTQLIELARSGDEAAVGELVSNYRNYLLLIANQDLDEGLQTKIGPSDVVQLSMLSAQANLQQFQGETEAKFRAWIRRILKNDLEDVRRKYQTAQRRDVQRETYINDSRQEKISLPVDNVNTPSTDAQLREQARLLNKAIEQLPDNYQNVIRLRNWEERSFVDIGKELDCHPDAARKLWYRAVMKLETTIKEVYPGLQSTIIQMMPPDE